MKGKKQEMWRHCSILNRPARGSSEPVGEQSIPVCGSRRRSISVLNMERKHMSAFSLYQTLQPQLPPTFKKANVQVQIVHILTLKRPNDLDIILAYVYLHTDIIIRLSLFCVLGGSQEEIKDQVLKNNSL